MPYVAESAIAPAVRSDGRRAAACLLVLLAIAHYDVVFLGRSLIATNYSNPVDWRALPENYGPRLVPHETWTSRNLLPYANIRDAGATWWQWEPSTRFLAHAIHDREWPFWDPYVAGGGAPAMANLVPAFFFPPYLAVVLLGASVPLLNAYFLFLVWAPAFFTFLFVRRHDVGFLPALTAAAAVMLGGMVHQHLGTFIGQTAACLPFVLYVTRRFFDRPSGRSAGALAVAYAVAALASFPPVLLAIFGIAAMYGAIALSTESGGSKRRTGALWLAALAVSIGLVAFCYAPALAARAGTPQMEMYRNVGLETMPLRNLYQIVSPTLMGGIQTYLLPPIPTNTAFIPYAGLGVVALALLARASGSARRRTLLLSSGLALALILLKLTGSPLVHWTGSLPVINQIHIAQYFGVPVGFLIACLAALGLHALLDGTIGLARAAVAALLVVAVPETLRSVAEGLQVLSSPSVGYWLRDWWVLAGGALATAVVFMVAAMWRARPAVRQGAGALAAAILAGDLLYSGWFPNPSAWSMFDHPNAYVRTLQHEIPRDRVFGYGAPNANLGSAYRVFTMDSLMAFNPSRSYRLYHRYAKAPAAVFMREAGALPPDGVLDRANVAAIAVNRAFVEIVRAAEARGYRVSFDDGYVAIFRRPTLPRFVFSSEYRVVTPETALEAIAAAPSSVIVLEQDPGVPLSPNPPADPRVEIESYRLNSVVVTVDAPRPGLLYASEAFDRGWSALVNGRPADILPANYAFRAVVIPAGHARVEFRYRPPGLTAGLAVTAASVLALGVLAFAAPIRRAGRPASAPRTTSAVP